MDRRPHHPPSHRDHHPPRCQSNLLRSHYHIPRLHRNLLLQLVSQLPLPLIYPERQKRKRSQGQNTQGLRQRMTNLLFSVILQVVQVNTSSMLFLHC